MGKPPISIKFRLGDNLNESASPNWREMVNQILEAESFAQKLPECKETWIVYKGNVPAGTSVSRAHGIWKDSHFPKVQTPSGFERQPVESTCPGSTLHVEVECIERRTPNMSSYYGFRGYFLSLLISLDEKRIWDVRGEQAS